jgi:hypothetical protein
MNSFSLRYLRYLLFKILFVSPDYKFAHYLIRVGVFFCAP